MDAMTRCKAKIREAIEEYERETGRPVLTAQMVAITATARHTYVDDPLAVGRTISLGARVAGTYRPIPWVAMD